MVEKVVVDDSDGVSVGRVWHLDCFGAGISDCAFHLHSFLGGPHVYLRYFCLLSR